MNINLYQKYVKHEKFKILEFYHCVSIFHTQCDHITCFHLKYNHGLCQELKLAIFEQLVMIFKLHILLGMYATYFITVTYRHG